MAQNVTVAGASYTDVPSVELPKTGGGTASFVDVTDTTATAADVAEGQYFYAADGTKTLGTATIGGLTGTIYSVGNSSSGSGTTKSITVSIPAGAIVLGAFGYSSGGQNAYRIFRVTDSDDNTQEWKYNTSYSKGGYTYTSGVYSWCPYFDDDWKDREITQFYCYSRSDSSATLRVAVSAIYLIPD